MSEVSAALRSWWMLKWRKLQQPTVVGAPSALKTSLVLLCLFVVAMLLGQASGVIGAAVATKPQALIALPLALGLGFVLLVNRPLLLLLILLTRAGLDPILDFTKLPVGGGMGIGALLNGLILLLTASLVLEKGAHRLKGAWFFLPFLACIAFGVVRSPLPSDAFKLMLSIVTGYAAFVVGGYLSGTTEKANSVMKIVVWSSFLPMAMCVVMWSTGFQFSTSQSFDAFEGAEANRFSGPFSHPNVMAFYILLVQVALLYLWRTMRLTNKGWVNLAAPLYLCVLIFFLLLTKTRSAWAASGMLFFLYGLFFERRFLVYLCLGLLCSLAVPSVQERIADVLEPTSNLQYAKLNSYAWRSLLWQQALEWMPATSYPLGMGWEAFRYHSVTFFELAHRVGVGAHNVYVEVFFELGALGMVCLLLVLVIPARRLLKLLRSHRLLASSGLLMLGLYALVCYSDNMLAYLVVNLYFWLMLGAITSANVDEQACRS